MESFLHPPSICSLSLDSISISSSLFYFSFRAHGVPAIFPGAMVAPSAPDSLCTSLVSVAYYVEQLGIIGFEGAFRLSYFPTTCRPLPTDFMVFLVRLQFSFGGTDFGTEVVRWSLLT